MRWIVVGATDGLDADGVELEERTEVGATDGADLVVLVVDGSGRAEAAAEAAGSAPVPVAVWASDAGQVPSAVAVWRAVAARGGDPLTPAGAVRSEDAVRSVAAHLRAANGAADPTLSAVVVVTVAPGAAGARVALEALGFRSDPSRAELASVGIHAGTLPHRALDAARALPGVEGVELERTVQLPPPGADVQ